MTKAEQIKEAWHNKTKTTSIYRLFKQFGEDYNPDRMYEDGINVYYLSDGSKLLTTRGTRNFQLWTS